MNLIRDVDAQLGLQEDRDHRCELLAFELSAFIDSIGMETVGCWHNDSRKASEYLAVQPLTSNQVIVEYRAKPSVSIASKMTRFNESLREMLDTYGFRVLVVDTNQLELVASQLRIEFWDEPSVAEMTLRDGTLQFSPFRDYRKRDWPGVSPLTAGGYDTAIHLNRKCDGLIVEIQVLTTDLYLRCCAPASEESHKAFKARQSRAFNATAISV